MMLNIETKTLKALLITASVKDVRYYLKSVFVTRNKRGNALLVSTDGHRMLFVEHVLSEDERLLDKDIIVPREEIETALKIKTGNKFITVVSGSLIAGSVNIPFHPIDAQYPDFRRVIPKLPIVPTKAATFCSEYVGDFAKVAALLSSSGNNKKIPMTVCSNDDRYAALVTFGAENAFGILMPLRRQDADQPYTIDLGMVDMEPTADDKAA